MQDDLALLLRDGGVGGCPVEGVVEQLLADARVKRLNVALYEIQLASVGLLTGLLILY